MHEQRYPPAPVMIKIDGAKVRAIREEKGLTQLYVATAVEVTTDTVSRWENKRYPTIKKENGLKLAEALEVELDEILDSLESEEVVSTGKTPAPADQSVGADSAPQEGDEKTSSGSNKKIGHLSIVVIGLILICAAWYLYTRFSASSSSPDIAVKRIVAPHFVAGQPLPVFLRIIDTGDDPVSIILKEDLPPGTRLIAASPPLSDNKTNTIKWLTKISGDRLYYYTITTDPVFEGALNFWGSTTDGRGSEPFQIDGSTKSHSGKHHWADFDRDNRISDEEILAVYDLLSNETSDIINLDLIEEMWLGEGYLWQPEHQRFSIIP